MLLLSRSFLYSINVFIYGKANFGNTAQRNTFGAIPQKFFCNALSVRRYLRRKILIILQLHISQKPSKVLLGTGYYAISLRPFLSEEPGRDFFMS